MTAFIRYQPSDGKIINIGDCPIDQIADQAIDGYSVIEGIADLDTDYILAGVVTPRPANTSVIDTVLIAADGVATCTISSIPNPSTVSFTVPVSANPIDTYLETDGTLTFSALEAGEYTISIDSFPYLVETFYITAV